jgi:hypothetical protein
MHDAKLELIGAISLYFTGVYISETAHPSIRGSLLVFQSLFLSIGMLIVFGVGYFFEWRILAWICGIPGIKD